MTPPTDQDFAPFRASSASLPLSALSVFSELSDPEVASEPLYPAALLSPLVAARNRDGTFLIIDGTRRFRGLSAAAASQCAAAIVEPTPDSRAAGLLRIALNRGRHIDIREQLLFLKWLIRSAGIRAPEEIESLMGLSRRDQARLSVLLEANAEVVAAIAHEHLDLSRARDVMALDAGSRASILALFAELPLSVQTQREFLEWLPEIGWASQRPIAALLETGEIAQTRTAPHLNGPQKIQSIRDALFRVRFPGYAQVSDSWNRLAAGANPFPGNVRMEHDPAFEQGRLLVHITINHAESARQVCDGLSRIPAATWRKLIDPIEYGDAQKPFYDCDRPGAIDYLHPMPSVQDASETRSPKDRTQNGDGR